MDTEALHVRYDEMSSDSIDRIVLAMNETATAVDTIAEKHGLSKEEIAHVLARLCEQLMINNEERT